MVRSSANRLISGEFPIYKNEFEENERVIDILFDNSSDSMDYVELCNSMRGKIDTLKIERRKENIIKRGE